MKLADQIRARVEDIKFEPSRLDGNRSHSFPIFFEERRSAEGLLFTFTHPVDPEANDMDEYLNFATLVRLLSEINPLSSFAVMMKAESEEMQEAIFRVFGELCFPA